jgi:undecaprenyl-diphosphatase
VGPDGRRLFVKVLDPDPFDRDWLYRLARLVAFRDVKDADALAPLARQAEHEAIAALTARSRGVRVPEVLLARGTGAEALVVQEQVDARVLDDLPPEEITARLLDRIWHQVALLHDARIAHRDLVASNVLVGADGQPWIVDFGNAETGAEDNALGADVAELMASLSLLTDPRLVGATAVDRLGDGTVTTALPALAPLALSSVTRAGLRRQRDRLPELRAELHRLLGLPDPETPALGRVGAGPVAAVVSAAALLLIGLPAVSGAAGVVQAVELNGWRWLGAAFALAVVARAATAAATVAAVDRRLAVGRTYGAHLVADGATLLRGRAGSRTAASRYLERAGVRSGTAGQALDRTAAAETVAAALAAAAALVLAMLEGRLRYMQVPASPLPVAAVAVGAFLLWLGGHALAGRHWPSPAAGPSRGRPTAAGLAARQAVAVVGYGALAVTLDGAALGAALHAVGGQTPLLATASAYAFLRLLWAVLPVIGAPGLADGALVLGLTAFGAPLASAAAGALLFRLLTYWGPAALGVLIARRFERHLLL